MGNVNIQSGPELLKYPKIRFLIIKLFGSKDWIKEKKVEIDIINEIRLREWKEKNKKPPAPPPSRQIKTKLEEYAMRPKWLNN